MNDTQNLWELIDLADVAVRAASQLRQCRAGHAISDPAALERAADFLERAQKGGVFLSGNASVGSFQDTLRPLNWATDTYIAKFRPGTVSGQKMDYARFAEYFEKIRSSILSLLMDGKLTAPQFEESVQFMEYLGAILGTKADIGLQDEAGSTEYERWMV